jgi:hypothetical protein
MDSETGPRLYVHRASAGRCHRGLATPIVGMSEQQYSSSSDQVLPLDLKERLVTRFVQVS